jgi:tetratricopeptide (TPR) repeat protein
MRRSLPAIAFAAAIVALLAVRPLAADDQTADPYIDGLAAMDQADYDTAAKDLAQAVQQNPNNEPAWYNLGVARFNEKPPDYAGAHEAFVKALALVADRPGTRLYLGRIYEYGAPEDYADAIKQYEDESARCTGAAKDTALVALGRVEYKLDQSATAVLHLQLATTAEPHYVEGLYYLGLAQTALKQYDAAIKTFHQAKQVLEDYADMKAGLSRMKPEQQRERKETEEKLQQDYGRAEEFAQDLGLWPTLNKALGDTYLDDKQYDLARNSYRDAMDKNQNGSETDFDVQVRLAHAYLLDAEDLFNNQSLLYTCISEMGAAEKAASKAIDQAKPDDASPAYEVQGEIYAFEAATYNSDPKQKIQSHTWDEAKTAFETALKLQPDNLTALLARARAYVSLAEESAPGSDDAKQALEGAQGDLQGVLVIDRANETAIVLLARVAVAQEKYDDARKYAEKALNLDPKDPNAYNVAGLTDYFTGRLPLAARQFSAGLELAPNDARLLFNLGNTYYQMQSWYMALREYQKALDHTPSPSVARTSFQRSYIMYQIALCYHETQRYNVEIDTLNDALALDASYFDAYMQLARAYAAMKEYRGAQRALEEARSKAPTPADESRAYALSGEIYEMADDAHSAVVAYASALAPDKDPNNAVAKEALGRLSGQS